MSMVPEDHNEDDEGHYFELRIDFYEKEKSGDDDEEELILGHINSHIHGAPPGQLIDSLLILARDLFMQGLKENVFSEGVPEEVRDIAASLMATQYLAHRLQTPEFMNLDSINAKVPDDVSSLLEG